MTHLETQRLVLRPPEAADADWVAREISRPEVQRFLTNPPHPYRHEHAVAWLESQQGIEGSFVIVADKPVGAVTLRLHQKGGELGYWLAQEAWGNGYMTEAAGAAVAWHFGRSDQDVPSGYIVDNPGSANVLTKLGFQKENIRTAYCQFRQQDVEIQNMVLTKAAWQATLAANPTNPAPSEGPMTSLR